MLRVSKKTLGIAGLVVVVAAAGVTTAYFLTKDNAKVDNTELFISALTTSQEAIKDGVTKENAEQALYVATENIKTGKIAEGRALAQSISDELLINRQFRTKYTVLLDSYRIEQNKDGFSAIAEDYKKAIATRDDPELDQIAQGLNQAYYDAVFAKPDEVPVDQEIP